MMKAINPENINQWVSDYIAGRLSDDQERRLEQYAMDQPLLLDALEGFKEHPDQILQVKRLQDLIVAPRQKPTARWRRLLPGLAAAIALIIAAALFLMPGDDRSKNTAPLIDQPLAEAADTKEPATPVTDDTAIEVEEEQPIVNSAPSSPKPSTEQTTTPSDGSAMVTQQEGQQSVQAQQPDRQSMLDVAEKEGPPSAHRSFDNTAGKTDQKPSTKPTTEDSAIQVGTARRGGATAKAQISEALVTYYQSPSVVISGRPALAALDAEQPWTEVWMAVDQMITTSNHSKGTATMRIMVDDDSAVIRPMKNMHAETEKAIATYLSEKIGLSSANAQQVTWLLKIEYK